jgi:hypothetical protein
MRDSKLATQRTENRMKIRSVIEKNLALVLTTGEFSQMSQ